MRRGVRSEGDERLIASGEIGPKNSILGEFISCTQRPGMRRQGFRGAVLAYRERRERNNTRPGLKFTHHEKRALSLFGHVNVQTFKSSRTPRPPKARSGTGAASGGHVKMRVDR